MHGSFNILHPTEALHSLTLVSRISESSVVFVMLLNCLQFETLQMSFWMKMFIFSSIYSDCPYLTAYRDIELQYFF